MDNDEIAIEQVKVGDLLPNPANPRVHPERALESVMASIRRFGFRVPIVANRRSGLIEAGHLRWDAAKRLGLDTVPVLWVNDDEVTATAFGTAENRLPALSTDEPASLLAILDSLNAEDALDDAVGWAQEELDRLRAEVAKEQARGEDFDVEEAMAQAEENAPELICRVKRGQVWGCGQHRVMCGDATSAEDVLRLMAGARAQAVVTDPPYGIEREGIANDDPEGLRQLYDSMLRSLPADDAIVIAFQSPRLCPVWLDAVRGAGHKFERMLWMYDESDITFPWRGWLMCSQAIVVSSVGKPSWHDVKPYAHDCYLNKTAGRENHGEGHPSVKPLGIVCDLISRTSGLQAVILDPFLGSGTTMIAAEKTGRVCYGMEIEPRYVSVSLARYEAYTGGQAILLEEASSG